MPVGRYFKNEKETGSSWRSQRLMGSLLGTCHSAIGQFVFLSPVTVPEVSAKVNSIQW